MNIFQSTCGVIIQGLRWFSFIPSKPLFNITLADSSLLISFFAILDWKSNSFRSWYGCMPALTVSHIPLTYALSKISTGNKGGFGYYWSMKYRVGKYDV